MKTMTSISYEQQMDKTITEVKMYILLLVGNHQQDIYDIVNRSLDTKQLQRKIMKRQDLALLIFTKIKKALDEAESLAVLEEHLVYLNILLDPLFPPVVRYKYNLFQYIVLYQDFTIQSYVILRHLLKFELRNLEEFIIYMCERSHKSVEEYHYLASEIYCIEHLYDDAYSHLTHVVFDEHLQKYKFSLYQYSPYKFKRIVEKQQGILQTLFSK